MKKDHNSVIGTLEEPLQVLGKSQQLKVEPIYEA